MNIWLEWDAEAESGSDFPKKFTKRVRHETLIQVGVAIGGLLGIFAEIGLLNRLVESFPLGDEIETAEGTNKMQDFVFVLVTIGFFAVAMAYVRGCDRLK